MVNKKDYREVKANQNDLHTVVQAYLVAGVDDGVRTT